MAIRYGCLFSYAHGRYELMNRFKNALSDAIRCYLEPYFDNENELFIDTEHSSIDGERHRASQGYVASKWVSEKIFMHAAERGIACNIFRLGLIWADTALGRYDELQREHRLLQSCLASGYGIQDFRYETPPTAVDYAARAIVALAMQNPHGRGSCRVGAGRRGTRVHGRRRRGF